MHNCLSLDIDAQYYACNIIYYRPNSQPWLATCWNGFRAAEKAESRRKYRRLQSRVWNASVGSWDDLGRVADRDYPVCSHWHIQEASDSSQEFPQSKTVFHLFVKRLRSETCRRRFCSASGRPQDLSWVMLTKKYDSGNFESSTAADMDTKNDNY